MAKRITEYIGTTKSGNATAQKQLRQLVERYPYYQAARLLMLRSLYETHDPSFGQELRRAALYVPSRRVLYELIEGDRLKPVLDSKVQHKQNADVEENFDRTSSLIDNFLSSTPQQEEKPQRRTARPTVDAATDYMGYMLQIEADTAASSEEEKPIAYGQQLLDNFLANGKITIEDHPDEELQKPEEVVGQEVLTETLARIYIKQGKYDKALEIIRRISLKYPKKSRYFADQIRYLEKIIANNNNKKS